MAARNLPGPYNIRNYRVKTYTVATNKSPIGPYRGVGRPGACFAIERTIDEVARAVGRDPAEVRMDNMVMSAQMPYTTIANLKFDNGDYPAAVRLCAQAIDLAAVRARQARGEPTGGSSAWALAAIRNRPDMVAANGSAAAARSSRATRAVPRS